MKTFSVGRRPVRPEMRALLATLLLSAFGGAHSEPLEAVRPEEIGMSSARLERLDDTLQGYVDSNALHGAVVLVARQGKTAHFAAFGSRDGQSAMQTDSIFRIASQTKALVSVGIMMLQEEGQLLLGRSGGQVFARVSRDPRCRNRRRRRLHNCAGESTDHDPGLADAHSRYRLRQRSRIRIVGRRPGLPAGTSADRDEPIADTIARLAELPFDAQPGERWVYGYATDILGVVIEQVSGQTLDTFLGERIFEPLGMADTHFFLPASKRQRLAGVYSVMGEGVLDARARSRRDDRAGCLRGRPQAQFFRRSRLAVDGPRLRALPADAAERR